MTVLIILICLTLSPRQAEIGIASWFSIRTNSPRYSTITASGYPLNDNEMVAAHKTLRIGTRVRVTRTDTGDSVDVTIIDRGPYKPGRVIDLSVRAAKELGFYKQGLTKVRIVPIGLDKKMLKHPKVYSKYRL